MDIPDDLPGELYRALSDAGAPHDLLAIVGSLGDTLSADDVRDLLREWDENGTIWGRVMASGDSD